MKLSKESLAFLKEQDLNPNWEAYDNVVEPSTVTYDNVVIRKISRAYNDVLEVTLYCEKYNIWIYVKCTPHLNDYVYMYNNSILIPNAILVSLPTEEEDCS